MDSQQLSNLWQQNKGKIIGVLCGLIFALFVISYGFWKAVFIAFCIAVGLFIGKKVDDRVDVKGKVERIFRD